MENKFQQMVNDRINGNISAYKKAIKKLTKAELVQYINYIFNEVECDTSISQEKLMNYLVPLTW